MDNVRILKGYSKEEQKELEEAKDNGFNAIGLIKGIVRGDDDFIFLAGRYEDESSDEDNLLARDIADYYVGLAKFPEPKKYYVKMPKLDDFPWLTRDEDGDLNLYRDKDNEVKQTFTMAEIEAIDPRYKAFAVPVEEL